MVQPVQNNQWKETPMASKSDTAFQQMWSSQSQRMAVMQRIFKYSKLQASGCIEWQGVKANYGYGRMTINKMPIRVHRLSWSFANGEDIGSLCVCHKCDNPSCINPEHLFLGTHLDNMRDCVAKNRFNTGKGRHRNSGTLNPKARLTEENVRRIRILLADKSMNVQTVADMYMVDRATIQDIKCNRTWKKV